MVYVNLLFIFETGRARYVIQVLEGPFATSSRGVLQALAGEVRGPVPRAFLREDLNISGVKGLMGQVGNHGHSNNRLLDDRLHTPCLV